MVYTRMTQGLFVALALTTLVLAACAPLATTGTHTPTRQPTPKAALTWHSVAPPTGVALTEMIVAVSPVDGHDAWACVPATAGSFTIWATKDAGASWQQLDTLSPVTPQPARWCNLVPDQYDAQSLVAVVSWGAGADGTLRSMSYFSSDGGAHVRALAGKMQTLAAGSASGVVFAIVLDTESTSGLHLAVITSENGQLRWHVIGPTHLASNDSIFSFWMHPPDLTMFAAGELGTLWRTKDAGASWTKVSALDGGQVGLGAWLPQQGHWLFCGGSGNSTPHAACSTDEGASWRPMPTFDFTFTCATCDKNGKSISTTYTCSANAIMPDGSLLADCPTDTNPSGNYQGIPGNNPYSIYRLTPGDTSWRIVGSAPSPNITVTATGQIWATNAQTGTLSVADLPA